jgi:hypothetical protein
VPCAPLQLAQKIVWFSAPFSVAFLEEQDPDDASKVPRQLTPAHGWARKLKVRTVVHQIDERVSTAHAGA